MSPRDPKDQRHATDTTPDPYNAVPIAPDTEERPTEDDLARATLGGPKGSPKLPPAPLTKSEEEQYPGGNDPGHVA